MATTLPKITPLGTPISRVHRTYSSNSLYGPYPPRDLSSSMDLIRIPQRINPLSPNPPKKRINMAWETTDQHWHNEKRSLLMQQREHQRYHSAWSKPFYGAPAEKEQYRKHFREVLKQQMSDLDSSKRAEFERCSKESAEAIKFDQECKQKDFEDFVTKHKYLQNFRDGNKQKMEETWTQNRNNKFLEDRIDRERLRYNPINWSCTLK